MLKNFINRMKNLVEQNKDSKESVEKETISEIKDNKKNENINQIIEDNNLKEIHHNVDENKEVMHKNDNESINEELTEEDKKYIKEIKIKRGKSIKAIDVYTKEPQIFKTHKECSKKLKIPENYIQENLKYGYTDYLGEAIKYLSKELNIAYEDVNYLESSKAPSQILNSLNNKIFTTKISEDKRNEILGNEKIEPVKMHYTFECIDEEYDDYFKKYKSIIKRGGKKKVELVDKKGEVIEIFKSLDECATFLNKEKSEIVDMLKYKDTKIGRNQIRYSLRNI
ncbi:hypothetical protein [Romboutsia sp.]|uniref:hypothetical protein n=1 Tax=Romboutsia sp. TaxID=1965302 RepID=UPI002C2FBD1C|nr:hypothetical protein [Romboutsia sp.]HSQ87598.1 hypothetical protein [Romboutsia sp.]